MKQLRILIKMNPKEIQFVNVLEIFTFRNYQFFIHRKNFDRQFYVVSELTTGRKVYTSCSKTTIKKQAIIQIIRHLKELPSLLAKYEVINQI